MSTETTGDTCGTLHAASGWAGRAYGAAGTSAAVAGAPGEVVAEIEEVPGLGEARGHLLAQPEQLRGLHLRRHASAELPQQRVPEPRDPFRLSCRPVVEPQQHVLLRFAVHAHAQRPPLRTDQHPAALPSQRACSIFVRESE
jgi:hypothetical protein